VKIAWPRFGVKFGVLACERGDSVQDAYEQWGARAVITCIAQNVTWLRNIRKCGVCGEGVCDGCNQYGSYHLCTCANCNRTVCYKCCKVQHCQVRDCCSSFAMIANPKTGNVCGVAT